MKTFFRVLIGVIIIGAIVFTFYFLYQKSKEKPVVYETTTAVEMPVVKQTVATGSVVPRKEIEIVPQVSGIIDELFVKEGEMIKKGDLIAKIRIIPNMINLNNAESRVSRAKIDLRNVELRFNRQKELYDSGVIPKQEFENVELEYKQAGEELKAAENNLALIREGQTQDQSQETNTIVRSTVDGMILDIPVEIGNSVIETNTFNQGTTLATIADMNDMIFEGKIDETEVGKIREGMSLILTVGAIDDVSFDAILEHIAPKGEEENGAIQFEIRANVKLQEDQFIRSGSSATAAIVLDQTEGNVLAIQERLLQFYGDSAYVEVETGPQQFEKRYVKTGLSDGINIEIVEGITLEDKIKVPSGG